MFPKTPGSIYRMQSTTEVLALLCRTTSICRDGIWEWTLVINNNRADSARFAHCPHMTRNQSLLPERKYLWLVKGDKISLLVLVFLIHDSQMRSISTYNYLKKYPGISVLRDVLFVTDFKLFLSFCLSEFHNYSREFMTQPLPLSHRITTIGFMRLYEGNQKQNIP